MRHRVSGPRWGAVYGLVACLYLAGCGHGPSTALRFVEPRITLYMCHDADSIERTLQAKDGLSVTQNLRPGKMDGLFEVIGLGQLNVGAVTVTVSQNQLTIDGCAVSALPGNACRRAVMSSDGKVTLDAGVAFEQWWPSLW